MALEGYTTLHLEITDDGTIQKWENNMVSLQKQVRYLRQELSNTSYNEAQRQSVRLLLADAQIGLQATQTRSRELFGSLSLLPGPMGNLFGVVNMTLIAMRELSQLSFNDLKSQFQILKSTFTGESLSAGIPRVANEVNTASNLANTGSNVANTTATSAEAAALGTTAAAQTADTIATTANTKEQIVNAKARDIDTLAILKTQEALTQEYIIDRQNSLATLENIETEDLNTKARMRNSLQTEISVEKQNLLNIQEKIGIATTNGLTASTEGLTGANVAATTSTTLFTVAMRALDVAIVIAEVSLAAFYALLGAVILIPIGAFLKEWFTGTNAATVANDQLNTSIKDTKDILDLDLTSTKKRQSDRLAEMKAGNASEAALRKQALENAKEDYNLYNNALSDARKNLQTAEENTKRKGGILGISKEELDKSLKLYEDAQKSVNDLEKKRIETAAEINKAGYSGIEEEQKRSYQNQLRDLEAKIELEIKKENTSKDELTKLIKQKNDLIDKENVNIQLSQKERDLRDKLDRKKINDAIIEDELTKAQAIIDLHTREKEAASKDSEEYFKSLKDIAQAEYDKQIIEAEKSEHDKANLILNAKTKLQKALDDITAKEDQAEITKQQLKLSVLLSATQEYYDQERQLEMARYKKQQDDYEGNTETLELLAKEHQQKMTAITVGELKDRASSEQEYAKYVQFLTGDNIKEAILNLTKKQILDGEYYVNRRTAAYSEFAAEKEAAQGNAEKQKQAQEKYSNTLVQIKVDEINRKHQIALTEVGWATDIGNILVSLANTYAKGNKDIQHLALAIQSAAQIAKIIIDANTGIATATAVAAPLLVNPFTVVQATAQLATVTAMVKTSEYIGIAGVLAATAAGFAQIDGASSGGGSGGGDTINRGKNYASGGMINGADHSQGGVNINAQGGEAVMTRGAVTMFQPLLSMMNQMGGGTAFSGAVAGQAKWDNPKSPGSPTEPQIIKTYVVQSELTSAQQRQARLKSLSTL